MSAEPRRGNPATCRVQHAFPMVGGLAAWRKELIHRLLRRRRRGCPGDVVLVMNWLSSRSLGIISWTPSMRAPAQSRRVRAFDQCLR